MRHYLMLLPFLLWVSIPQAEVITGKDEQAQLPFWELRAEGMSFRLVQRLPDQTRAYFAGRGFNRSDVSFIAGYCLFQSIFTNTSSPGDKHTIEHNAADWRVVHAGKEYSLVLREAWRDIWQQRGAKQAQSIAFEWSLLPTQQRYQSSDYNWGMTVYKLPHGSQFNLKMLWKLDGKKQHATIKNVQCAKDVYIPPPPE